MLVSTIVPCYKGARFLAESLTSAINQTYKKQEILVIDDGTPDDSVKQVCEKFLEVQYIRQNNKGLAGARNTGIHLAKGDVIAFLDDDDLWETNKLELQIEKIKTYPQRMLGLISTGFTTINEKGETLQKTSFTYEGHLFEDLLFDDFVGLPSSVVIPKFVFEKTGLFDENIRFSEDYDLWLRIAASYSITSIPKHLTRYRQRVGSMSRNPEKMIIGHKQALEKALASKPQNNEIIKKLLVKKNFDYARRYKRAAYDALKEDNNISLFCSFLKEARAYSPNSVTIKDNILTILAKAGFPIKLLTRPNQQRDFNFIITSNTNK